MLPAEVRALIRDVPDFPTPGILFRDIGPLLADATALAYVAGQLGGLAIDLDATVIAGIESRGFLLGAPAAVEAGLGFVPLRKGGKLPGDVEAVAYGLEYGEAVLELQRGLIAPGTRVLVVDDVLATGGTAGAAISLLQAVGAEPVHVAVLLELAALGGRAALDGIDVTALLTV